MPQYSTTTESIQVAYVTVLRPKYFLGFAILSVVLLIHLALVAFVTVRFARQSRYTNLGSYWQSVAQMSSVTKDVILGCDVGTDNDVKRQLRLRKCDKVRVGLVGREANAKIAISSESSA